MISTNLSEMTEHLDSAMQILIICGSIRTGRKTSDVSEYLLDKLKQYSSINTEYLDLKHTSIPFLEERLKYLKDPPESIVEFSKMVKKADAILIVSPEYNGGFPGVLKNALDFLVDEYKDKKAFIATVSAGRGGKSCYESLVTQLSRLGADVSEKPLHIKNITEAFNNHVDKETEGKIDEFINDIV